MARHHETSEAAPLDCLIIGGGPAGLLAAIYLARFRRRVCVVDAGASRAELIPQSNNVPGFAHGLSGTDLLARMSAQIADLQVRRVTSEVTHLTRSQNGFHAAWVGGETDARAVVLACGIVDHHPPFQEWRTAIADGLLRYCPVCDAYEAIGRRMGVIGPPAHAAGKALFLRGYSRDVTVLATEPADAEARSRLAAAGVEIVDAPNVQLNRRGRRLQASFNRGDIIEFDIVYPAMGAEVRSQLAVSLGAKHTKDGYLSVDDHQRTSVEGLYGIGDVVTDVHQISVAFGHAAVAACAIHNSLPRHLV
ncbi:NAD(P)/FAD-dependent oxidoreductase [Bradyrhizobium cosmicum]|uniref:NAD(P)/FAD-dependent oxidoreductase n=1 Tax=Bradyrhizobium cosmicum TaxID=1404864 RepID=UPI0028E6FE60|nr:NAD(P)/FAD-dependent oxidoreductase [Bradyrhizobium cosmicum]